MSPSLVYADDAMVAVDKPAGMLSVPGRGEHKRDCAALRVAQRWPNALIVHRLDMGTSGLLVFARGAQAQRTMSMSFAGRSVHKRYEAVVQGLVAQDEGEIDLPLIADWPNRPLQKVDHDIGKPSLTRWQVMSRDEASGRTRLSLEPVTGRSHQLRVHLMSIGHPIVGDELYDPVRAAESTRMLLHACELRLPHPVSGQDLMLQSTVPF
ncbi:RluA family pseudouridine synthase [Piscinibacter terrae]|nr:RluA family pseudouridine synthase [Albitalea terrae]